MKTDFYERLMSEVTGNTPGLIDNLGLAGRAIFHLGFHGTNYEKPYSS